MSYCAQANIEAVFGARNVNKWADLDEDASSVKIAARIAAAIAATDSYIDAWLRGGIYAVPVNPIPACLTDAAAKLAGCWLYESRGVEDWNPETGSPGHRLRWSKAEAMEILRGLKYGLLKVPATQASSALPGFGNGSSSKTPSDTATEATNQTPFLTWQGVETANPE